MLGWTICFWVGTTHWGNMWGNEHGDVEAVANDEAGNINAWAIAPTADITFAGKKQTITIRTLKHIKMNTGTHNPTQFPN